MSVCIVQNLFLSLLFGFLFCRIKKCTKMRHISGELRIQYSMKYSTVGPGFESRCGIFLKKLIPQSYQVMSKTAIFCFVCFCQSLAVCEAIFFFFNFALFTFFLVRQNFTGANNLTKKWGLGYFFMQIFEIMNLVRDDREKKYK